MPLCKILTRTKLQALPQCKDNLLASSSSAWPLVSSPHPASMPTCSTNAHQPVTPINATAEVVLLVAMVAVASSNNQTYLVVMAQACSHPLVPLPPTSVILELLPHPQRQYQQCPCQCNVWEPRTDAQPKRKPCQHHGQIGHQNAQDNFTLSIRLHSSLPSHHPQQQQLQQQHPMQGATWQHVVTPPVQFGEMPTAGGKYRQRTNMVMPVYQPSQTMTNLLDKTLQVLGLYQ
jgi:hypothetical protein